MASPQPSALLPADHAASAAAVPTGAPRPPAELEMQLAAAQRELAACRTALAEQQSLMDAARAQNDDATRFQTAFLANMSHEIRTPMNAVLGMSHLLLATELDPKQRDYLQKIRRAGRQLLGLINDLLDFGKLENGQLELDPQDFDLQRVLSQVVDLIGEKCQHKGLELVFDIDPALPQRLRGDALRLGQVLINLADNAVKFTERGEIVLRAQRQVSDADGVGVRFEVQDTGIGIAADRQRWLFQPFRQADGSTTRRHGGTGLGLAICRRLVHLMGGTIGVTSEPGLGSQFWFTVQLALGAGPAADLVAQPDLRGRRVLVVDDHAHAREVLVDMLRHMRFEVGDADSGTQALHQVEAARAAGQPYELVLLDWNMPGLDGLETARRLLAQAAPPHLILVTAHGREDMFREAERVGIGLVLVKPVNPSLLFDAVIDSLGNGPHGTQRAATVGPVLASDLAPVRGARVLLVDDNDLNQQVGAELLRAAGLAVDLAADGRAALQRLEQLAYDLVLMDMDMPELDGLAATRLIRARPEWSQLPVLAMTANASPADREACLAAGMNGHIAKPIEPEDLFAQLLHWIAPRAGQIRSDTLAQAIGVQSPQDAAAGAADPLAQVPGLDLSAGLRRVLNRRSAYESLLRKFVAGQADAIAQARLHLAAGRHADAHRLLHTLKGTAGTIGAVQLAVLAEAAEQALTKGGPPQAVQASLAATEAACHLLAQALREALDRTPPPALAPDPPPQPLQHLLPLLDRLEALLAEDDADAIELFHASAGPLRQALGASHGAIERALENYVLVDALAALRAARSRLVLTTTAAPS